MAKTQKSGWYPDPQNAGSERHWDGNAWGDSRVAPPQKKKRRGSLIVKIALGLVLGITLLIVGCTALLGAGVNSAQKDSDKTAITQAQYDATKVGEKRSVVEARLGKPSSKDQFSTEVEGIKDPVGETCVYYNRRGDFASTFQLCFDINTDKLESKTSI